MEQTEMTEYSYLTNRELFHLVEHRPNLTPLEIELLNRLVRNDERPTFRPLNHVNAGYPNGTNR
jgi:hypothetical protein